MNTSDLASKFDVFLSIDVTSSVPKCKMFWQAKLTCPNVLYLGTEGVIC